MTTELWLAYVTTALILMSTPGPSHLLMLSNSLGNGFNRSLATAAGDLSANIVQMTVASLGLVSLIHSSQEFFVVIKWVGVSYLIFMGVMKFRKRFDPSVAVLSRVRTLRSLYWQGFMTSAANPKAVIFFAALFPQFVNPAAQTGQQFVILGVTYLIIDACFFNDLWWIYWLDRIALPAPRRTSYEPDFWCIARRCSYPARPERN